MVTHLEKRLRRMCGCCSWLLVQIWFKLYLNLIGAFMMVKEQIWDRPRKLPPYPDQEGKLVVITGGGRGIGQKAVEKLVKLGARVVLGCRDKEGVQDKFDKKLGEGAVQVLSLDLMDLASVRQFAEQVLGLDRGVEVLICNAGIMFGPRRETEHGFESQLATNYLGHFLLVHLLLPSMERVGTRNKQARVVNVSSIAHYLGSWLDLSDINLRRMYSPEKAYGNSKVAQVMFTKYLSGLLQERGANLRVFSLHPGVVYTGLYTHVALFKVFSWLLRLMMKTTSQGADTLVHAALDPDLGDLGEEVNEKQLYLENCKPARSSSHSGDLAAQQALFEVTCDMLDIQQFGKQRV